jgi:DNA ligase-1
MKFANLAQYLEKLEKTSSRNEITNILSDLFKKSDVNEIDKISYLLSGNLAPKYEGIILNIAERTMQKIISRAYTVDLEKIKFLYKEKGDLGDVCFNLAKAKGLNLSITDVYEKLVEIAREEGSGSQERKIVGMTKLLSELDPLSAKFVARIPVGRLRLGFSDMTILDALSFMLNGDKSARREIEAAFNVNVDIGKIARAVKDKGLKGVKNIQPVAGTPIRPSLAERLPSAEKILEKVGDKVAVEPKFDGFRCGIHVYVENGKKKVKIFSRNLENTTNMFPDLAEAAKKLKVKSAIIDGEAIAYDAKNDKFLPFQETAQRKRKYGIEEAVKKLPLKLFVFDILYKDGKGLLDLPFSKRREILKSVVGDTKQGIILLTKQDIVTEAKQIRDFVSLYLKEGLEGALIKKIDAPYKAGGRGYHWVKYKKTTDQGVADTIDCLVMGIYKGRGKRTVFGVGAFLVGVKVGSRFKTTSKIGTGLSDEQWRELARRIKNHEADNKPQEYEVDKNLNPDIWVEPFLVVEILADEITKSPIHTAKFALRFPRLIKFRDEKNPDQATTLKELERLYLMQKSLVK